MEYIEETLLLNRNDYFLQSSEQGFYHPISESTFFYNKSQIINYIKENLFTFHNCFSPISESKASFLSISIFPLNIIRCEVIHPDPLNKTIILVLLILTPIILIKEPISSFVLVTDKPFLQKTAIR